MPNHPRIAEIYESHARVLEATRAMMDRVQEATDLVVESLRAGGTFLIAGNGGSAADAQHIAGEFVGRFLKERKALPCIALNTNSTIITAIGNDYSYDRVFSRQVEAFGKSGDVLLAITTSGNSGNIIEAARVAKSMGIKVVGLTGQGGGKLAPECDLLLDVPSTETPRVQEMHIMLAHILCELAEIELAEE